jgi:glucosamine-6-phosphate isomerase
MKVNIFNSYNEMSAATADFLISHVQQKPESLLCLASGDTPTGTLKNLVSASHNKQVDFSSADFVGLDEWVGMDKNIEGSCQHYIYTNFFDLLNISQQRIKFFNAKAQDLRAECSAIDKFIADKDQIDLLLVGVGVNGHIGLNEPGSAFNSLCHVVPLADSTKKGAEKYFSDSKVLKEGITIGLAHMLNAKTVIVIASGIRKSNIIKQIIEGPVTESVPGSVLQRHPNCHFFLDREAASALSDRQKN